MPPIEEQLEWFSEFNPTLERVTCAVLDDACVFQSPFDLGLPCKIIMTKKFAKILYGNDTVY